MEPDRQTETETETERDRERQRERDRQRRPERHRRQREKLRHRDRDRETGRRKELGAKKTDTKRDRLETYTMLWRRVNLYITQILTVQA